MKRQECASFFINKGGKKEKAYLNAITSEAIFNYLSIRQNQNGQLSSDEYLFVSLQS